MKNFKQYFKLIGWKYTICLFLVVNAVSLIYYCYYNDGGLMFFANFWVIISYIISYFIYINKKPRKNE